MLQEIPLSSLIKIILSKNGIDINAQDNKNKTVLHYALRVPYRDTLVDFYDLNKALFQAKGINFDLRDNEGYSVYDIIRLESDDEINELYKAALLTT